MTDGGWLHIIRFHDGHAAWQGKVDRAAFWPFVLTPREMKGVYEDNKLVLWWLRVKKVYHNIRWWLCAKLAIDPYAYLRAKNE